MLVLNSYLVIALDFDGVIKQSNESKGLAFLRCFPAASKTQASHIYKYHLENPAMSRSDKFKYFLEYLGENHASDDIPTLLGKFKGFSLDGTLNSAWVPGVLEFIKKQYLKTPLYVITAMPQLEIEVTLSELNIQEYFAGVYGYPLTKEKAIQNIIRIKNLDPGKVLFIGDAYSDYVAAKNSSVDFCLIKSKHNKCLHGHPGINIASDFWAITNHSPPVIGSI